MPFTLAHPAAILPLWRRAPRRLSLLGLVLGALVPDLDLTRHWAIAARPHFDREATFLHSPLGILTLGVPAALVLGWVFERYVRRTLPAALPPAWTRPGPEGGSSSGVGPGIATFLASVLLGAATHVLWDSCTSAGGLGGKLFPFAKRRLFTVVGMRVTALRMASFGSSALGLALIARAARRPPRPAAFLAPRARGAYWAFAIGATLASGVAFYLFRREASQTPYDDLARFLDGCMAGGFAAIVLAGAWVGRQHRRGAESTEARRESSLRASASPRFTSACPANTNPTTTPSS
jgi:hypothetical protein